MPLKAPADLSDDEEALRGTHYLIDGQARLSFGSNDYLGLSQHPALIVAAQQAAARYGVGATASPLVCGHSPAHEALELELAALVGLPRALYFYAGYAANVGIIPALVGRGDAVFSDALNHACLIDGIRLSRAELHVVPHADLDALAQALQASTARRKLVVTDAVFSMDGDLALLPELLALAERFDAWLVIDDAHGFGVLGQQGRGSLAHFALPHAKRIVYMGTLGKAAGGSGAFVAGSETVVEWLLQRARTYIFTTGSSPAMACALLAGLDLIEHGDERRRQLRQLTAQLRDGLADTRWQLMPSPTAIQPVIIGDNHEALRVANALFQRGLWVPAVRPPTVPKGTARLRVSLTAAHTGEQVAQLVDALRELA